MLAGTLALQVEVTNMQHNPFLAADRAILADSGTSGETGRNLFALCDGIGARFAGTGNYRRAAEFMLDRFREYGLENAALEPFEFTAWRRGAPAEFATTGAGARLHDCYELPYSAATGPGGVEAGIADIGTGDGESLGAMRGEIGGRFVLTVGAKAHRTDLYAQCAALGAAGFVIGHTIPGMGLYTGTVANGRGGTIPAISIGHESAMLIRRQLAGAAPRFRMTTHGTLATAATWNVVGELPGSELPDELVIMGGHLDSHEIGPGAFDNGAGAVMVIEAARLLARCCRGHLKRTVRFIGFAAEEIGLLGSHHHAKAHAAELRKARFMLNCDTPALGRPRGLGFHKCPRAQAYMDRLAAQMETPLVCQNRTHCHSDHYPFILQGLPTAGIAGGKFAPAVEHFAHMAADTPEKISLTDLRDCAAFAARVLLRAASDPEWPDMRRSEAEIAAWKE